MYFIYMKIVFWSENMHFLIVCRLTVATWCRCYRYPSTSRCHRNHWIHCMIHYHTFDYVDGTWSFFRVVLVRDLSDLNS